MDRFILLLLLLYSTSVFAEANGLLVFFAIAGLPLLLALAAIIALFTLGGSSSSKSTREVATKTDNPSTKEHKANNYLEKVSLFIAYAFAIYLSFIPTYIFPNNTNVLIFNTLIVGAAVALKVSNHIDNNKGI